MLYSGLAKADDKSEPTLVVSSASGTVDNPDATLPIKKPEKQSIFEQSDVLQHFDIKDVSLMKSFSGYLAPNPRKIKRIVNIFRAVRLLALDSLRMNPDDSAIMQKRLLLWIILIEQWPVRMAWLLQVLQDDEQTNDSFSSRFPKMPLYDIYKTYVESRVYDTRIDFGPPSLASSYHKVFILDADPEIFDELLKKSSSFLKFENVGNSTKRVNSKLLTYTINLNPALQAVIACIAGHREEENAVRKSLPVTYQQRSVNFIYNWNQFKALSSKDLVAWIKTLQLSVDAKLAEGVEAAGIDGEVMDTIMASTDRSVIYETLAQLGLTSHIDRFKFITAWASFKSSVLFDRKRADVNNFGTAQVSSANTAVTTNNARNSGQSSSVSTRESAKPPDEKSFDQDKIGKLVGAFERTTDDKFGKDHIGYLNYANILSMMVQYGVSTPVVFGLYATWGTGKSFIMNKSIASLKMFWMHDRAMSYINAKREKYLNPKPTISTNKKAYYDARMRVLLRDKQDLELALETILKEREDEIDLIYRWCLLGCPPDAVVQTKSGDSVIDSIDANIIDELYEIYQYTDFDLFNLLTRIVFGVFLSIFEKFRSESRSDNQSKQWGALHRTLYKCYKHDVLTYKTKLREEWKSLKRTIWSYFAVWSWWRHEDNYTRLPDQATDKSSGKEVYDYEFVWWNAWLYSGSDNLWAGLIQALYEAVESRYGPDYCNAQQKANVYKIFILGSISLFLLIGGIIAASVSSTRDLSSQTVVYVISVAIAITTFVGSAIGFLGAVKSVLSPPTKQSQNIAFEVKSEEIKSQLGFMAKVKAELGRLGNILENPTSIPNVWDFMLPNALGNFRPTIKRVLTLLFGGNSMRGKRSCKLVIYVDDLDRCQPDKIVEVLQSLVLLTESTPFVVFLAIDPRIIVAAIESVNSKFFSEAGVSGYEYLDKIVHIPFAIPPLVSQEKSSLVTGYMMKNPMTIVGTCDETFYVRSSDVNGLIQLADGRLASTSNDGSVKVWNIFTRECEIKFEGHRNMLGRLIQIPDGRIVSAGVDGTCRIWCLEDNARNAVFSGPGGQRFWSVVLISYDTVAVSCLDGDVLIWNTSTLEILRHVAVFSGRGTFNVVNLALTPTGKLAACSKVSPVIKLIDLETGTIDDVSSGSSFGINSLVMLYDGTLAVGAVNGELNIVNLESKNVAFSLVGHLNAIKCMIILNDGRMVSSDSDGIIKIWNLQTKACDITVVHTTSVQNRAVMGLAQLSDGRLASACDDETIKIWI